MRKVNLVYHLRGWVAQVKTHAGDWRAARCRAVGDGALGIATRPLFGVLGWEAASPNTMPLELSVGDLSFVLLILAVGELYRLHVRIGGRLGRADPRISSAGISAQIGGRNGLETSHAVDGVSEGTRATQLPRAQP